MNLTQINQLLDSKYFLKVINIGAIALYIDFQIGTFTSAINTNESIIFWKVTNTGEHHVLDFLGIIISFFVLCVIFYKYPNIKVKKIFGVMAFFTNYTLIGLHESAWYIDYYISGILYSYYVNPLWIVESRLPFYLIIIGAYLFFAKKGWIPYPTKTIAVIIVYFSFWTLIGFPITIDYFGHTVWYSNLSVNILEIYSWLIPIFVFLVEQSKYLTKMVNKSKLSSQPLLTLPYISIEDNHNTDSLNNTSNHSRADESNG